MITHKIICKETKQEHLVDLTFFNKLHGKDFTIGDWITNHLDLSLAYEVIENKLHKGFNF